MEADAMYFPYLRGRQFELLALRELANQKLLGEHIIPIIEPVKLSSTLVNTLDVFVKNNQCIAVILNPMVGNFGSELEDISDQERKSIYQTRFSDSLQSPFVIKSLIMQDNTQSWVNSLTKQNIEKGDLLAVNASRDHFSIYETEFSSVSPRYVLIPDESTFRRRVRKNKVLLDDKFEKQSKNAAYKEIDDEFFSDDHLYYKEDNFIGFSDYSIVGDEYSESGFAPRAVAIHIVYLDAENNLRIHHFVSDSNEDYYNPAGKFYEAVSKLYAWYQNRKSSFKLTLGFKKFLEHYKDQSYPGLGTVKKLSIMHHLELMSIYLNEV